MPKNLKSHLVGKSLTQWLSYLETIHNTEIDMGLERISIVAKRLNIDLSFAEVVTVAGTNGKGTTCAFIENALIAQGKSVAVYSSPHIEVFNERLRINKQDVDDQALINAFEQIERLREEVTVTYYEFTTLAAFLILMVVKPEVIILEVGLGGRLDATNIIDTDVAVITSIDLDHQAFLGNDRESIGFEKAGIMREQGIAVVGDISPPQSVLDHMKKLQVRSFIRGVNFQVNEGSNSTLELASENSNTNYWHWSLNIKNNAIDEFNNLSSTFIPQDNVATALTVLSILSKRLSLELSTDKVNQYIEQTKVPGRTELISYQCNVLLDVGHNPHAARYLSSFVSTLKVDKIYAVAGMLEDKDIIETFAPLLPLVTHWYLGGLNVPRGASAQQLAKSLENEKHSFNCFDNVTQAFKMALKNANATDLILVFGSFYTVAEVRRLLV